MPPRLYSRHTFTTMVSVNSPRVNVLLNDRRRFFYQPFKDNRLHTVREGDSWHSLAARYYAPLADPPEFSAASLWWAIADFQTRPVHDPTIMLRVGDKVVVPSLRVVRDSIFNPTERARLDT